MDGERQHPPCAPALPLAAPGDREGPLVRRRWWTVLAAAVCAAATVLFLPFSEHFVATPSTPVTVREVSVTRMPQPPEAPPRAPLPAAPAVSPAPPRQPMPKPPEFTPELPALQPFPAATAIAGSVIPDSDYSLDFQSRPMPADPSLSATAEPVAATTEPAAYDQPPVSLVRRRPVYPAAALRRGVEGHVDVTFTVSETGRVSDVRVLSSNPGTLFNQAALDAVRQWRFQPATRDGSPVPARLEVRIRFEMDAP